MTRPVTPEPLERRAWILLALVAACFLGCHRKPLVSSWLLPSAGTYELVPTNAVFLAGTNRGPLIDVGIEYSVINTGISAVPRGAYTIDLFIDGTLICWDHAFASLPPSENVDYTFRTKLAAGQHSYNLLVTPSKPAREFRKATNQLKGTFDVKEQAANK